MSGKSGKATFNDLQPFDVAEFLEDEEDIAAYLAVVIEENDTKELLEALDTIARARGMTEIAKKSGMTREALYRALGAGREPRFETINKVCKALGVQLTVKPVKRELAKAT